MRHFLAPAHATGLTVLTLVLTLIFTSPTAHAQTPAALASDATSNQDCDIGYVTGVAGALENIDEYLASPNRDKIRYIADHPIDCKISDEGRATACTGITYLKNEQASVYDDSDSVTTTVSTHVELDRGTYTVIIAVPKQDMHCKP
jgi:hypothetical protein